MWIISKTPFFLPYTGYKLEGVINVLMTTRSKSVKLNRKHQLCLRYIWIISCW